MQWNINCWGPIEQDIRPKIWSTPNISDVIIRWLEKMSMNWNWYLQNYLYPQNIFDIFIFLEMLCHEYGEWICVQLRK